MANQDEIEGDDAEFRVDLEQFEGRTLLRLSGVLGAETGGHLLRMAKEAVSLGRCVCVDWESAEYVGPAAMQCLLALSLELPRLGAPLTVCRDCAPIREFLGIAGIDRYFPVEAERSTP